jgi:fumarate hydratase class II
MMPMAGIALLESITLLATSSVNFAQRCVEGLQATERGPELVEEGLMLATAFAPVIGYDEAGKMAKEALRSGRTIREVARERGFSDEELDRIMDPAKLTEPGLGAGSGGGG